MLGRWQDALLGARDSGRDRQPKIAKPGSEVFSLTAEQLEASRAERMRLNGRGQLTFEDARTWLEETGLCLFLPRRQFATFTAPTFVEAVAGEHVSTPSAKLVSVAEDLLVRLESESVAVRLNLLGQPGDSPDFVVAAWVLPYVYALRGDRDWRRIPQLTGSRQVSQLAIQAYKQLETGDATITQLRHSLGREVSESAVLRAITELWQQLRIIPVVSAPGKAPQWQLLRLRYQKAIAEGASTSQVTAISVLASIYLQAVIAASMEEVEMFLAPLTARSKVREVLRGLVATRQVHSLALGHAPHFYVAGTLPEFAPRLPPFTPVRPCRLPRTSSAPMSTRNRCASRCNPSRPPSSRPLLRPRSVSRSSLQSSVPCNPGKKCRPRGLASAISLPTHAIANRRRLPPQAALPGVPAATRAALHLAPTAPRATRTLRVGRRAPPPRTVMGTGMGPVMRTATPARPTAPTACTRQSRPQQELCAMATPPTENLPQSLSHGAPTLPARARAPKRALTFAVAASRRWQPQPKRATVRAMALLHLPIGDRKNVRERTPMSQCR